MATKIKLDTLRDRQLQYHFMHPFFSDLSEICNQGLWGTDTSFKKKTFLRNQIMHL